jgi:hypothetical protein
MGEDFAIGWPPQRPQKRSIVSPVIQGSRSDGGRSLVVTLYLFVSAILGVWFAASSALAPSSPGRARNLNAKRPNKARTFAGQTTDCANSSYSKTRFVVPGRRLRTVHYLFISVLAHIRCGVIHASACIDCDPKCLPSTSVSWKITTLGS